MIDPICDMTVEPDKASGKADYNGKTYYFCSVHCPKLFNIRQNPLFRFFLQPTRRAARRGHSLSALRHSAEPDDRQRRDDLQLGVGDRQCAAAESRGALIGAPFEKPQDRLQREFVMPRRRPASRLMFFGLRAN